MSRARILAAIIAMLALIPWIGNHALAETRAAATLSTTRNADSTLHEAQVNLLVDDRYALIDKGIRVLRSSASADEKAAAAFLLGELVAVPAVPDLVDAIQLEAKRFQTENPSPAGEPRWSKFPAQEALVKIGMSALPRLMSRLSETDDGPARTAVLNVITAIVADSPYSIDVKTIVRQAAEKEVEAARKKRLENVLNGLR